MPDGQMPPEDKEEYSVRGGWSKVTGVDQLASALSKAQSEVLSATKDTANPFFKSKYADLAAVWDAIREPLTKNGLSVVQFPCEAPAGHVGLLTVIMHTSGQHLSERFYMPVKDATNPQAVGSAITYARRYALSSVVGVCPEDDDGNAAAKGNAKAPATTVIGVNESKLAAQLWDHFTSSELSEKKAVFNSTRWAELSDGIKKPLLQKMADVLKAGK